MKKVLDELRQNNPNAYSVVADLAFQVDRMTEILQKGIGGRITFAGMNGAGKSWILVRRESWKYGTQ